LVEDVLDYDDTILDDVARVTSTILALTVEKETIPV
jgi:hypothetical protein